MTAADVLELRGEKRGILKGRVEGRVEGIEEGMNKAAMNCLRAGMPPQEVAPILKLDFNHVLQLQQKLKNESE